MARLLSDVQSYELMVIVSPEIGEIDFLKKISEIKKAIEEAGGKITTEDNWGMRPLAFRIKKHDRGMYFILNFNLEDRTKINELNKMLFLDNGLLRHLLTKTPAHYTFRTLNEYDLEAKEIEKLEQQAEDEKIKEEEVKAEKRLAKITAKKEPAPTKPVKKVKEAVEAPEIKEEKVAKAAETEEMPAEEAPAALEEKEEAPVEAPAKTAKEIQKKKQKEELDELDEKLKQIMDNPDITI